MPSKATLCVFCDFGIANRPSNLLLLCFLHPATKHLHMLMLAHARPRAMPLPIMKQALPPSSLALHCELCVLLCRNQTDLVMLGSRISKKLREKINPGVNGGKGRSTRHTKVEAVGKHAEQWVGDASNDLMPR